MANFNTISAAIWEDEKFLKIEKSSAKLLFIYLFTNPRCPISGIYKVSPRTMSFETNIPNNCESELEELISVELISYDYEKNVLWVQGKIKHDKSWTTQQRIKSVCRNLDEFHNCSFISKVASKYAFLVDWMIELEVKRNNLAGAREGATVSEAEKAIEKETGGL